jgi:hypothetical protein
MTRFQLRIGTAFLAVSAFSFMGLTVASAEVEHMSLVKSATGAQAKVCLEERKDNGFTGGELSRSQRMHIRQEYRLCIREAMMLNNGYAVSHPSRKTSSVSSNSMSRSSVSIARSSNSSSKSSTSSGRSSNSSNSSSQMSSTVSISSSAQASQSSVVLGAASTFGVLAGSTVTNTGLTSITGDVGVSAGSEVTGFPPGVVSGGAIHASDTAASQAQLALTTAYNNLAGRSTSPVSVSGNLGGSTLAPGLYKSTSSLEISSGDLTLDAKGNANAIFIFQIASTLDVTSGRKIVLIGGAKAANIYWQVGTSANLGSTSVFKGSILADQSISLQTGANVEGRLLARIGGVTLQANTITVPSN